MASCWGIFSVTLCTKSISGVVKTHIFACWCANAYCRVVAGCGRGLGDAFHCANVRLPGLRLVVVTFCGFTAIIEVGFRGRSNAIIGIVCWAINFSLRSRVNCSVLLGGCDRAV